MSEFEDEDEHIRQSFVQQHGHVHLWSYMQAHPGRSVVDIACEIEDGFPPGLLQMMSYRHCLRHREMADYVRDQIFRKYRSELPQGWAGADEYDRSQVFFLPWLRNPYRTVLRAMEELVFAEAPQNWSPTSPDDPLLVRAWEQAVAELPEEQRALIAQGEQLPDPGDLCAQVTSRYDVSIYDGAGVFLAQFAKVPREAGHVLAASWCETEVSNGGIGQLFANSTGVLVPEAIDGFQAIGMPQCGALLNEAMKFLGPRYPRDRARRLKALRNARRGKKKVFEALTDELLDQLSSENGGFKNAADAYCVAKGLCT